MPKEELEAYYQHREYLAEHPPAANSSSTTTGRYQQQTLVVPPSLSDIPRVVITDPSAAAVASIVPPQPAVMPGLVPRASRVNEKAMLLNFQELPWIRSTTNGLIRWFNGEVWFVICRRSAYELSFWLADEYCLWLDDWLSGHINYGRDWLKTLLLQLCLLYCDWLVRQPIESKCFPIESKCFPIGSKCFRWNLI